MSMLSSPFCRLMAAPVAACAWRSAKLSMVGYGRYRLSATMAGYQDSPAKLIDIAQPTIAVDFQLQPSPLASRGDGFVEGDGGGGDRPEFRASGVEGATAPSGYSAAASADEAAVVTARGRVGDGDDLLLPPAEAIPERNCNPIGGHACPRNFRQLHSGPLQADAKRPVLHVGTAQLAETLSFAVSCHEAR
jgi:hypothetical protein